MMPGSNPLIKDVVLIGGGHAHALLLRAWGMRPVAGARLTLINPAPSAPYTGMLPGHVAGHYKRDALEIDLVRLARHAGARLILGQVDGMDRSAQRLHIPGRPDIPYDIASLDIGITSEMPSLPGFGQFAVSAKPLGPFAEKWRTFLSGDAGRPVIVIGGGVAGVELALAMQHRLQSAGRSTSVCVIEAKNALSGLANRAQSILRQTMRDAGITLIENTQVKEISETHVHLDSEQTLEAGLVVGAAGARPFDWLKETGLDLTDGFITVDASLRAINDPHVYAAGDCAHLSHAPRPKAGVFAVRAAPILTHNIRADLTGDARRRFEPQSSYLKLISLGRKLALTDKWGLAIAGDWVWTWKDRIDRAFMSRLSDLPPMTEPKQRDAVATPSGPLAAPLCGGCGAKVGGAALDTAIARHVPPSDDPGAAPGDDAAILTIGGAQQVISTDHLRAFWDDPYLMARIAAVHALGDVWAMGAAPQAMLAQIVLPRMDERLQTGWLDDILAGASEIAEASGAKIVGGHTTMGAEMTLGFTVTGLLSASPLTLSGARSGDALVLTRPIGSGTLLAAEMAGRATGRHVTDALSLMAKPQGDTAKALAPFATSMTDVTGFGLAGHLARMANASNLTAVLDLASIPLFEGAEALASAGIKSTLYPTNRADVLCEVPDTPRAVLLFDPQTAGGFLAAIPSDRLQDCLSACGHAATHIGHFTDRFEVAIKAK